MRLRTRYEITPRPLIDIPQFADDYRRVAGDEAEEAAREVQKPYLEDLQYYPAVPAGSRYVRTYKLKRGWRVNIVRNGDVVELLAGNDVDYTRWVVGTFDVRRGASFQTAKHKQTGWPLAQRTADFWFDAYIDLVDKKIGRITPDDFGGFTGRRRNR